MAKREFRWLTIRIPIINLVAIGGGILLLAIIIAFVAFGGSYMKHRADGRARAKLEEARTLLVQVEAKKIPPRRIQPVKTLIRRAEHFLESGLPREAIGSADDAVQQLRYMLASYKPEKNPIEGRYVRISEIHGTVEMLPPGSSDWVIADLNQVLRRGTRMRTKRSSTVELKFDDGSTLQMKENSLVIIRELSEDEATRKKSSNIELGTSHINAQIKEDKTSDSSFRITMPDSSQAEINTESNLEVEVDERKKSVVKVFMGRVEITRGEQRVALTSREAVILDPRKAKREKLLKTMAIPLPPRLMYPANVQLLTLSDSTSNQVFFRWTSVQDSVKYHIEIARDYYFYDTTLSEETADNRFATKNLEPGNYYWRVSSENSDGLSSEPSPFNSFRIVLAGDLSGEQKDLTPPELRIDRLTMLGHIVDIAGHTDPTATLYVNEQEETVHEDGSFRALVEFKKSGLQVVFLEAYDSAGNVATVRREVTIP